MYQYTSKNSFKNVYIIGRYLIEISSQNGCASQLNLIKNSKLPISYLDQNSHPQNIYIIRNISHQNTHLDNPRHSYHQICHNIQFYSSHCIEFYTCHRKTPACTLWCRFPGLGCKLLAALATIFGTKITEEACRAVGCTTSIQTFAFVIDTARLTLFVALLAVKTHCTFTDTGAMCNITRACSTWSLTILTIKSIHASIYARSVGVKTRRLLCAKRAACRRTVCVPVSFPTSTKTYSCRPVAELTQ